MRSIVLAAGRGERLNGVAAAFHKPLLIINGRPLIVDVVQKACSVSEHCTIVCAPQNVAAICELVEAARVQGGTHSYTIQPSPRGPGDAVVQALITGHELTDEPVLILMADNVLSTNDVCLAVELFKPDNIVVATRRVMTRDEASRFTRVHKDGTTREGPAEDGWSNRVWCGPLVVPEKDLWYTLTAHYGEEPELKIGKYLGGMGAITTFDSDAVDVGVPSEVTSATV